MFRINERRERFSDTRERRESNSSTARLTSGEHARPLFGGAVRPSGEGAPYFRNPDAPASRVASVVPFPASFSARSALRNAAMRLADAEQSGTPRSPEGAGSEDFSFPFDELGIGEPKPIPLQPKTIPLEPKSKFAPQERKFTLQERKYASQERMFHPQERRYITQEPSYTPQEPEPSPEIQYLPPEPKTIPLEATRHTLLSAHGGRSVEPKSIPLERSAGSRVPVYARLVKEAADSPQAGLRIRIHFIGIRIQHFRLNTNPDPDPIRIRIQGFNDQKWKKKLRTAEKKLNFFDQKLQFTYP
jgi:hypothetical protein